MSSSPPINITYDASVISTVTTSSGNTTTITINIDDLPAECTRLEYNSQEIKGGTINILHRAQQS